MAILGTRAYIWQNIHCGGSIFENTLEKSWLEMAEWSLQLESVLGE